MNLVSDVAFKWFLTIVTGGVAGAWFIYDSLNLLRLRGDRRDPIVGDKRFGYVMGIVIGLAGVFGCLLFQGVV